MNSQRIFFPILVIAVMFMTLLGCSKNDTSGEQHEVEVLVISEAIQKSENDNFEDLFTDVEIIPLETSAESLLKSPTKIVMDEYIYFMNFPDGLLIFNRQGEFLNSLVKGNGPGEITQILDFQVMENGDLYVLDYKSIKRFSPEGNFIDEHKLNRNESLYINPNNFCWFDEDNYFLWVKGTSEFNVENKDKYHHLHEVRKGKVEVSSYEAFSFTFAIDKFNRHGDKYYLTPADYDNYVYEVTKERGVQKKYRIDFGRFNVDRSQLRYGFSSEVGLDNFKKIRGSFSSSIARFMEVRGYIYFDFVNGGKYQYLFYNKENKEFFSASHKYVTIDGMLPFRIINRDMKEDKVLAFVEPYMLFDYLKKNNINLEQTTLLDKDDIELLSKMKEDDNPYLIKLSIK